MDRIIVIWTFFLLFLACKQDKNDIIPYVTVDQTIYLTDPQNFDLNFVGGWKYLNGGSRGIVVYRLSLDAFMAFDRHCTFDVSNPCGQVSVDSNSFFLTDTCCGSSFIISTGAVYKNPAKVPLQNYRTSFYNNALRIFN